MFGFLPAPCGCFSQDERSVYRAHFCGLCNALRHRYGLWSRLLVNRDAAFLSLLGSALCETEPEIVLATCCNPLAKPRSLVHTAPHVDYAAAVTVCGLAVKLDDDADDEPGLRGRVAGISRAALRTPLLKAVDVLEDTGFPVSETLELMRAQKGSESVAHGCPTEAAQQTRLAYGNIFAHLQKVTGAAEKQEAPLRSLGEHLGELIYLMDAWEDYADDQRRGRFNPLPEAEETRRAAVRELSGRCIAGLTSAFNALHLNGRMPITKQLILLTMPAATMRRIGLSTEGGGTRPLRNPTPEDPRPREDKRSCWERCDCGSCDCDPVCCDTSGCDCLDCHGCHSCDCNGCDCPCDGCDCSCH